MIETPTGSPHEWETPVFADWSAAAWEEWTACLAARGDARARALVAAVPAGATSDLLSDSDGVTPLIAASAAGRLDLCSLLLAAGADPDKRDNFGRTALAAFATGRRAGDEAEEESQRRRARQFFLAAGAIDDGEPVRFVVEWCGDIDAGPRERDALKVFWRELESALARRFLPFPLREPELTHRRVWLLNSQIMPVAVTLRAEGTLAARKGLADDFRLTPVG